MLNRPSDKGGAGGFVSPAVWDLRGVKQEGGGFNTPKSWNEPEIFQLLGWQKIPIKNTVFLVLLARVLLPSSFFHFFSRRTGKNKEGGEKYEPS